MFTAKPGALRNSREQINNRFLPATYGTPIKKEGVMTGTIRFALILLSTMMLSSAALASTTPARNFSSKQAEGFQLAATDVQGIPPGGLPPMDVPPAGGQTVFIGRYAIRLPQGSVAQPKQNGITEVQQPHKGHRITAEIRPLTNVAPVPSHEQLRTVMNRVNPDMKPIGEPVRIQKPAQLRGFAVGQFYQQVYPKGSTGMVSGLFIVHVAPEGQGLALDVFSPAASNNQNLDAVNEYAGILMNSLRDSR
jgi:hypothetical protein